MWKVLGALALWFAGGWCIRAARLALGRTLLARHVDPTMSRYADGAAIVLLSLLLVIAILSPLGIETTSFAALLAAAGIAIGAAWAGLLANFAAGLFLMVLRPFHVGDTISAAGVTGTVFEIGLFMTSLDTPDGARVVVGNNKLFSDTIHNYSANAYRRVSLTARIPANNPQAAIRAIGARLTAIPGVAAQPAPVVAIERIDEGGAMLCVEPSARHEDYWDVYHATNPRSPRSAQSWGGSRPIRCPPWSTRPRSRSLERPDTHRAAARSAGAFGGACPSSRAAVHGPAGRGDVVPKRPAR